MSGRDYWDGVFRGMRFDEQTHLGGGDVRLTPAQQEDIVDALDDLEKFGVSVVKLLNNADFMRAMYREVLKRAEVCVPPWSTNYLYVARGIDGIRTLQKQSTIQEEA